MKRILQKQPITGCFIISSAAFLLLQAFCIFQNGGYSAAGVTIGTTLLLLLAASAFLLILQLTEASLKMLIYGAAALGLTVLLQSASIYAIPYLSDRCNLPDILVQNEVNTCLTQTLVFIGAFMCTRLLFRFGSELLDKHLKLLVGICSGIQLLCGVLFIFTPGKTASIHGILVGLPMLAVLLFSLSAALRLFTAYVSDNMTIRLWWRLLWKKDAVLKIGCIVSFAVLLIGYAARREFGIPAYLVASIVLFCLFGSKHVLRSWKSKLILYAAVFASLLLAAMFLNGCHHYFTALFPEWGELTKETEPSFVETYGVLKTELYQIGSKVERMFTAGAQARVAAERFASSGWLGNPDYKYLPAAVTDYAVTLCVHYTGYIWLVLLLAAILVFSISGRVLHEDLPKRSTVCSIASELSFYCILALLLYPLLTNLGITGVIGVNCFAAGKGLMHQLLCGILLAMSFGSRK